MACLNCGADDEHVIPVWEDPADYQSEQNPKYLGCTQCHRMVRFDPYVRGLRTSIPQVRLTEHERSRVPLGNQHSDDLTLIEWQCVKGAAMHHNISDWTSKVDSTLTMEENIGLMEREAKDIRYEYGARYEA